ncbi:MAG: GPW/gp25 family protein [Candidatus Hodarchaeales archaeon]|jgi:phage baseplate assembly protein W
MPLSIRLPLTISQSDGYDSFSNSEVTDAIKQNIKMLLLTRPGERIYDAELGVGLENFLFDMADEDLTSRVKTRILDQFQTYLPYVIIENMVVTLQPDSNSMQVSFVFSVDRLIAQETFDIEVSI